MVKRLKICIIFDNDDNDDNGDNGDNEDSEDSDNNNNDDDNDDHDNDNDDDHEHSYINWLSRFEDKYYSTSSLIFAWYDNDGYDDDRQTIVIVIMIDK